MTRDQWITTLERELASLTQRDRSAILQDARHALAESGVDTLGDPITYAQTVLDAYLPEQNPNAPQATLGPAAVEFRGPVDARVRARLWDPTNPRIIIGHQFGIGWGINFGAVAVKLGLLRPDDYDDEAIASIPTDVRKISRLVPPTLSVVALALTEVSMRTRSGVRQRHAMNILAATAPLIWSRTAANKSEDELIRNAIASASATISLVDSIDSARHPHKSKSSGIVGFLTVAGASIVFFVQLVVPVRAGLRNLWREEENRHEISS